MGRMDTTVQPEIRVQPETQELMVDLRTSTERLGSRGLRQPQVPLCLQLQRPLRQIQAFQPLDRFGGLSHKVQRMRQRTSEQSSPNRTLTTPAQPGSTQLVFGQMIAERTRTPPPITRSATQFTTTINEQTAPPTPARSAIARGCPSLPIYVCASDPQTKSHSRLSRDPKSVRSHSTKPKTNRNGYVRIGRFCAPIRDNGVLHST